ncbi:MAG: tetratricopeptide repeat protein [Gammaproteobacteria bacterium]|nr:tetratricopeptide repeat protein [Gammaproteobacteria bacterium]
MAEREKPKFTEDEDMERARAFWKSNGSSIVGGIVLGLAAIVGYNYWQYLEKNEGEGASSLFDQIAAGKEAMTVADDLIEGYSGSPYASLGALAAAKTAVESNDIEKAKTYLNWILSNSKDEGILHIARLRLGAVLLSAKNSSEALSLLKIEEMSTFASRYHELIGDANVQLGNVAEAKEAYQRSLDTSSIASGGRQLIQLKLENVSGA